MDDDGMFTKGSGVVEWGVIGGELIDRWWVVVVGDGGWSVGGRW